MQELEASGARPRRRVISGLDALTPSERRVAEMAARGMTNRDIAQTLFLSVRTIENQLRQVYLKLDIGSRKDLPERPLAVCADVDGLFAGLPLVPVWLVAPMLALYVTGGFVYAFFTEYGVFGLGGAASVAFGGYGWALTVAAVSYGSRTRPRCVTRQEAVYGLPGQ